MIDYRGHSVKFISEELFLGKLISYLVKYMYL